MTKLSQNILLHIGFPKTGSTFLQSYFESHPSIHHNRSRFREYVQTGKLTENILEDLSGDEKVDVLSEELLSIWSGDTSKVEFQTYNIAYEFLEHQIQTANQLHSFYPNAKILIVVRGYYSLMNSLYSQYILTGGSKNKKYFIKENEETVLRLFNYDKLIEIYSEKFSNKNLIVLPFEWLQENPKQFLEHLEMHMDVEPHEFSQAPVHGSIPKKIIFSIRMTTKLYKLFLQIFYKKTGSQRFNKYLEKVYHFKDGKFGKMFKGKTKKFNLSDSFIEKFEANSSKLGHFECFNSYISKYRK